MSPNNQKSNWIKSLLLNVRSIDFAPIQPKDIKMKPTKIKNTGRKFAFIVLFLSLLSSFFPTADNAALAQAQGERKQVLYINSYHMGFKFSDEILSAITAVFKEQGNIDLRIEYLDTKRINDPEYYKRIYQLFEYKYKDANLDLVMSSDDAALNFLFDNADTLFPDIPVVFVGANFFDVTRLAGHERFTGISEEADIAGTLDIALNLHPETKRVVVVNDTTVTGQKIHQIFTELMPQYPQITFEFLEDVTMDEIRQRLGTLSQDSLVLLTIFSKDKAGSFFEYDQFTSLVAESSSVPVYGTWDFSLGYGIVGGKLTSGYTEGERAAKLALRILAGENPGDIPVDRLVKSRYMFDYKVLDKRGIEISRLPEGSVVLDRPVSFYEENRGIILGVSIGFIILIFIIAFLAINNNQRRRAQVELAMSNRELQTVQISLEQRVADRTKAIATSSKVSHSLSTILNQKELVTEVVNQVNNAFNYYHTQIYFYDEGNENLVMAGGTGEAGETMLTNGHKVPKGRGLVGRAAESNQPILVSDTAQNPDWLPNQLLPDTKSETAIPISIGDEVLGVLDVQHNIIDGLKQEDVDSLQSIANQVAIAVQNAQSYTEIQRSQFLLSEALKVARLANWEYDVEKDLFSFNDHFYSIFRTSVEKVGGYKISSADYARNFVHPDDAALVGGEIQKVMDSKERYLHTTLEHRIIFADGEVGYITVNINVERDKDGKILRWYGANQDVTERRRLEELNRKRAAQQEAINLITQKIQNAPTIEASLQVAARELGHALGMKSTMVTLEPEPITGESKVVINE